MALTRRMLRAMGIEDEKIEQIIEAHGETVDALKEQRDQYKADAEKLPEIQKKLEEVETDGFKQKYETILAEYNQYKADQEALHLKARKIADYGEKVLKPAGVPPERWDAIIRLTDIDAMEYGDAGLTDVDHLIESVKTEWADYIPTVTNVGAETANPPANSAARTFTRDEIRKMTPREINENFNAIKASLKGEN